jgi:ribosomal protein L32
MDERKRAGAKAGIVCLVLFCVTPFFFLSLIVGSIYCLLPGALAVHFGRKVIKNGKDAAISISIAATISALWIFLISFFSYYGSLGFFVLDMFIVFLLMLLFILLFSFIGGIVYAKYGLKLFTQGTIKPSSPKRLKPPPIPYCPKCGDRIERSWIICPHCGTHLENEKRYHDDDTKAYDDDTEAYDDETKVY